MYNVLARDRRRPDGRFGGGGMSRGGSSRGGMSSRGIGLSSRGGGQTSFAPSMNSRPSAGGLRSVVGSYSASSAAPRGGYF